eukprot:c47637_g1_i1 orf=246-590(-)
MVNIMSPTMIDVIWSRMKQEEKVSRVKMDCLFSVPYRRERGQYNSSSADRLSMYESTNRISSFQTGALLNLSIRCTIQDSRSEIGSAKELISFCSNQRCMKSDATTWDNCRDLS